MNSCFLEVKTRVVWMNNEVAGMLAKEAKPWVRAAVRSQLFYRPVEWRPLGINVELAVYETIQEELL